MSLSHNEMDQWVTDTFYSYFPSFNKIEEEKRTISRARQRQEYKDYLSQIPLLVSKAKTLRDKFQTNATDSSSYVIQTNHPQQQQQQQQLQQQYQQQQQQQNLINDKFNSNNDRKTINYINNESQTTIYPVIQRQQQQQQQQRLQQRPQQYEEVINSIEVTGKTVTRNSARTKLLEDLKHTELQNILNTDTVAERNKRTAEEEVRKKMEYQRDLVKQIEEKRLEIESLKQKEKREEELLTRRLEEQLQTLELEKELEKEKIQSEKVRLANEQNHLLRMRLLSKLENDHKLYNPYDVRKTQSENGKDNKLNKDDDKKIYKYFSNSARYDSNHQKQRTVDNSLLYLPKIITNNNNNQYCKNCRTEITNNICNFCNNKLNTKNIIKDDDNNYHDVINTDNHMCTICHKKYMNCPHCDCFISYCYNCNKNTDLCINCKMKNQNICPNCKNDVTHIKFIENKENTTKTSVRQVDKYQTNVSPTTTRQLEKYQTNESPTRPLEKYQINTGVGRNNSFTILDIDGPDEFDSDYDSVQLYPLYPQTNNSKKPYSMNVEKDSLFHPNKKIVEPKVTVNIRNGEVFVDKVNQNNQNSNNHNNGNDEIINSFIISSDNVKKKNDELLSNYVKNYSDLRVRKTKMILDQNYEKQTQNNKNNSFEIKQTNRNGHLSDESNMIRLKVPSIPKRRHTDIQPKVLTLNGVIKKQLQLEQLQIDKSSRD